MWQLSYILCIHNLEKHGEHFQSLKNIEKKFIALVASAQKLPMKTIVVSEKYSQEGYFYYILTQSVRPFSYI